MDKLSLKAYGKVNLSLDIVGKKKNGYHLVDMILHSVGIYDLITIEKTDNDKIVIDCNEDSIPTDERNIIYKAADIFFDLSGISQGIKVSLIKSIPAEAGMGGGSADAAATLLGLNKLFETNMSMDRLKSIGLILGADVPFCIEGGCARAEGIGELLTKLQPFNIKILVVKPKEGVSTVDAYRAISISNLSNRPDIEKLILEMSKDNINEMVKCMGNVFYEVSSIIVPKIKFVIEIMSQQSSCIKAMMSGSGSTVFGIFETEEDLKLVAAMFDSSEYDVFCTSTVKQGVSFV